MPAAQRDFAAMTVALFDRFSDACTLVRGTAEAVDGRCIVDEGVDLDGQYGKVRSNVTTVAFIKSEWFPQRGDVVTLDGVPHAIDSITQDDGMVVTAVLHG